jgi:hypothetical protein
MLGRAMGTRRILIGEPFPEVLGLLERLVRGLGYQPLRLRPSMRLDPPQADLLLLERSYELGRQLVGVLRRRNPGLRVVYLEKPFRLDDLRDTLAAAYRRPRVDVSVSVR